MGNKSDSIGFGIEWSFGEEAPSDRTEFLDAVVKYNKEVRSEMGIFNIFRVINWYNCKGLNDSISQKKIKVKYEYATESKSGEWLEKEEVFEVTGENDNLTKGEILYWLHTNSKDTLKNQDYYGIEEIFIVEGTENNEIPTYEVFFGS